MPGGSSFGPPNGEPKSVKFNVAKGLFSTLIKLGVVLEVLGFTQKFTALIESG